MLAAEVTAQGLAGYVVAAVAGGVTVAGVFDRRRKEITATWKELAEAKAALTDEQDRRLATLEAKVEILQSSFMAEMVSAVASGVVAHLKGQDR